MRKLAPALAAAMGISALLTLGAPAAHASEKSDCEGKGGTYSETTIVDNSTGKTGTRYSCCIKDAKTNTTSCTSSTVTAAQVLEPVQPAHRVPLGAWSTDAQIVSAATP